MKQQVFLEKSKLRNYMKRYISLILSSVVLIVLWLYFSNKNIDFEVQSPSPVDPWPQVYFTTKTMSKR